jgi:hypothetical protein
MRLARRSLAAVAVSSVAMKPDDDGGQYVVYFYDDRTAELWHRTAGGTGRCLVGRQILGGVRREMAARGISEEGWMPG